MPFLKHRNEQDLYAFEFAARLAAGETLSAPQVTVTLRSGNPATYADKTAEFTTGSPTVSGTKVQFTMKAAAQAADQAAGAQYVAYAKVSTNQGRILVSTTSVTVSAKGV